MTGTKLPNEPGVRVLHDCRDAWVATLIELAEADDRIVAVVNDSVGSSKLAPFADRFPGRLINVGIAEQDMVGVGAGLANGGKVPFVSAAACFLTARAMEQIKVDAAYSAHHVVLVGQSPGMAYGELGPTHHSIEDLAWLRAIPGLTVVVPADPTETAQVIRWAAAHDGPVFVRVSRMGVPDVTPDGYSFTPGQALMLRPGRDITLVATGVVVVRALDAAELLRSEGIEARVLHMPTIKPLDSAALLAAARETAGIVTVEEALTSGLGGAVAELLVRRHPVPMRFVGVPDTFAPTGSEEWLLDYFGISADGIAAAARELVDGRAPVQSLDAPGALSRDRGG
jgi:transketolase